MSTTETAALERLKTALGPKGWTTDPAEMAPHLVEWRDLYQGRAAMLLKPASTAEVAQAMAICAETGTPVVPQGGNTGLVGGGIPFAGGEEVVLSLSRLNRVRELDPLDNTITVEAGCVLAAVQAAAAAADRLFPLRIGSEGSCQIGGNLSTNAGGTAVLHYGNTRELVLGIEVVLADGRIWDGLRRLRKDNTGYDLKQLFIGAEGTLGIVTAAVLKLFPKPRDVQVAVAAVTDVRAAVALLSLAREASGDRVTAFELMPRMGLDYVLRHIPGTIDPFAARHDWQVLIELSGGQAGGQMRATMEALLEAGMERDLVVDAVLAGSQAQAAQLWRLRDAMSEAQKPEGGSIKHDISVPVSRIPDFIDQASRAVIRLIPGTRIIAFGHIGDGNIHFNPSQPVGADRQWFLDQWEEVSHLVHDIAASLGGSISAEHGIGRMKREEIVRYKPAIELELMRRLKRSFDPQGILNPGKTFPS